MLKLFLVAGILSVLPIWKDVLTNEGLTFWGYLRDSAFTQRKHITPEEAIENYRRNTSD